MAPGQCELGVVLGRVLPPLSDGENKKWKKPFFVGLFVPHVPLLLFLVT